MRQIGLRISWLTQGLPTLPDFLLRSLLLPDLYHFGCYRKSNYSKIHPSTSLLLGWTNIFPPVSGGPLLGRDILTKLGTTLVMGSLSAPRALQLLVTTEEPIAPSIERDQKLWEDKINPHVWDEGILGRAHQAEPVTIVLRDPTQFPNWKQ